MKRPETLRELLYYSTEGYGDRPAFLFREEKEEAGEITYRQLGADAKALARGLEELGLRGKNIGIMGENSYWWCLSYLAVTSGVGVAVPLDKELPIEETDNIISFARLEAIICDEKTGRRLALDKGHISREIIIISRGEIKDTYSLEEIMKRGYGLPDTQGDGLIKGEDTAVLLFTSGTTGMAKGVELTHRNICSDLIAVSESVKVTGEDVTLSVLPLHHAYETIAFLMIIYSGGSVAFCKSVRTLAEDLAFFRPTALVTVPLLLEKLHKRVMRGIESQGKRKRLQLFSVIASALSEEKKKKLFGEIHSFFGGRLTRIIVGAAALKKEVAEDFFLFGIPVIIGYGLTECSPIVICNTPDSLTTDTIGKPLRGVEVKIEDADEKGIGEICVRGPMVMKGYYKNEEATKQVMKDGYLYTGDLGCRDKNGNYRITGRKKNVIVHSDGKNIYPEEIEYYLHKSPVVADCMVYSSEGILSAQIIPDTAAIALKLKKADLTSADTERAVTEAVRALNRRLPSYKSIKRVKVRSRDFIRTATQKIKRDAPENLEA